MNIIFKTLKCLIKRRNAVIKIIAIAGIVVSILLCIKCCHYKSKYNNELKSVALDREKLSTIESDYNKVVDENKQLNKTVREQQTQITTYKSKNEELQKSVNSLTQRNSKLLVELAEQSSTPDNNYYQARLVWNKLKGNGLNDYVCAGIMGNIMAEVGGQTLDISRWSTFKNGYYGICQWAGSRKSRLLNDFGKSLIAQADFLCTELFEIIPKDNSFYNMQNEKQTALYFAKNYERCSSKYYTIRQTNATKALKYFAG